MSENAEAGAKVLGELSLSAENASFTLKCDALALTSQGYGWTQLYLASVAGPVTSIKSFAASLNVKGAYTSYHVDCPGMRGVNVIRSPAGFHVYRHKLGYNCWHALAVAKDPGLMVALSETALWRELRSERFTTPIVRSWMPWLMQRLLAESKLVRLRTFQCQAALLQATTSHLDELVTQGLSSAVLSIPAAA